MRKLSEARFGDFVMKNRKNYTVAVTVDLYDNSTDNKFDAFARRISGTNIALRNARTGNDSRTYTFGCTESGVGILLSRWSKRLGSGMADASVSVA
jgi:hypothetical protein